MKLRFALFAACAALIMTSVSVAQQAPAGAPAGSTGLCKDGSYTTNATKKGACAGHKGVKDWYAGAAAPTAAKSAAAAGSAAGATTSKTVPAPAPAARTATRTPSASPAVGGGPGQVWVNTDSKVYHCPGTRYYGKTKQGEYMTESAAKAAGARADHGKACS
jgi:hypothetical protein